MSDEKKLLDALEWHELEPAVWKAEHVLGTAFVWQVDDEWYWRVIIAPHVGAGFIGNNKLREKTREQGQRKCMDGIRWMLEMRGER